jgi:hypothetical protein
VRGLRPRAGLPKGPSFATNVEAVEFVTLPSKLPFQPCQSVTEFRPVGPSDMWPIVFIPSAKKLAAKVKKLFGRFVLGAIQLGLQVVPRRRYLVWYFRVIVIRVVVGRIFSQFNESVSFEQLPPLRQGVERRAKVAQRFFDGMSMVRPRCSESAPDRNPATIGLESKKAAIARGHFELSTFNCRL